MSEIWVPPGGSADPDREREREPEHEPQRGGPETITPEQLAEQVRRLKVSDVLLSTLATVAQLGYAKLDQASRDLDQARLAIEAFRALLPVVEGEVEEQT